MPNDETYQSLLNILRADIKKLNLNRKKLQEEKKSISIFQNKWSRSNTYQTCK